MQALAAALKRHPVVTNVCVYGTLYVGAEFFQQTINRTVLRDKDKPQPPLDTGTLARYGVMGTCVLPHTLYHAYKFLDGRFPGNSNRAVACKLAVDALILTPVNLTLFYVGMSTMERKEDVLAEWKAKMLPTFIMASVFWIPANFINFKMLPPHARVVFVGACQIIWVSIICWFKRQDF